MAKDITKPDTLRNVHEDDEGTGIFWFIDNSNNQLEQVFIPGIKRKRAQKLASDFDGQGNQSLDAYRWVPNTVESAQALIGALCGGKCDTDLDCVDNACRCIGNRCTKK